MSRPRKADGEERRWHRAAVLVERGARPVDACLGAGIEGPGLARLGHWGDCWVELLTPADGQSVLLVDDFPGLAAARISAMGAKVTVTDDMGARAKFRQAALGNGVEVVRLSSLLDANRTWDVVVIGPFVSGPAVCDTRRLAASVADGGRLVVVVDNRLSPLRTLDRAMKRPVASVSASTISRATDDAEAAGFHCRQTFALLRSSLAPVSAFDVEAPAAAKAVLEASATFKRRGRLAATRLLARLAERGSARWFVPAWMAVMEKGITPPDEMRVTGRIGVIASEDPSRLLRGEPPRVIDKRYWSEEEASAEFRALRELEASGVHIAPRAVERLGPKENRLSWLPGTALNQSEMSDEELLDWATKAGELLAEIHVATARNDGTSLLHGDFWLSNLLSENGRLVGIIDWSKATRGRPFEDVDNLVTAASFAESRPEMAQPVSEAVRAGYERAGGRLGGLR